MKGGQDWSRVEEERFEVVAVTLFGKIVVARYATLEQAEWRANELGEEAERNPRGYVQYLARPAHRPARELGEEAERNPRGYVQYLARPARGPSGKQ